MELAFLPPDSLRPYRRNPRIAGEAVRAVARSIQRFGFNAPIVIGPDNRICAGHVRWEAAKSLGLKEVPVLRIKSLRGARFKGYNVADNQTAGIAEWDAGLLKRLLEELVTEGVEAEAMGFSAQQWEALLGDEVEIDWDKFDQRMRGRPRRDLVLLPVKVPRLKKEHLAVAIRECAARAGIRGRDRAVVAGLVIEHLLENA
jgi:hypothetical protein